MLTLEEVVKEKEEEEKRETDDGFSKSEKGTINRLSSFRRPTFKGGKRASLLGKMMMFKSLRNLEINEEDKEEEEEEQEEDEDEEEEEKNTNLNQIITRKSRKKKDQVPYIDPPFPLSGQPIKYDLLLTRNKKAEMGMNALMEMVNQDVFDSIEDARKIPVSKHHDRVTVTEEISKMIAKSKTTKDIERDYKRNVMNIQKSLNYRRTALLMMNSNYSKKHVQKVDPIQFDEARTINIEK